VIPARFSNIINAHILGNVLDIPEYPLILSITGKPGMGKTYQLRNHIETLGFAIFSVSSADLESDRAGVPAKLIREQYVKASYEISHKKMAAVVIDDIDTTVGEWEQNTGTVNHQDILAFFMHIADSPRFIETIGRTERVPVFFTGNNFSKLYEPLRRPGRMAHFEWDPSTTEKIEIVSDIFSFSKKSLDENLAEKLVEKNPDEPISFFSELLAKETIKQLSSMASAAMFKQILSNDSYKQKIAREFYDKREKLDWLNI